MLTLFSNREGGVIVIDDRRWEELPLRFLNFLAPYFPPFELLLKEQPEVRLRMRGASLNHQLAGLFFFFKYVEYAGMAPCDGSYGCPSLSGVD